MSWYAIIPSEILSRKDISANEKLLVGLIASLSHKEGHCFASNQYMADCLGVSSSAIRSYLRTLEELKIVSRIIKKKESGEVETREIRVENLKDLAVPPLSDLTPPSATFVTEGMSDLTPPSATNLSHNIRDNNKEKIKEDRFDQFWNLYGKKVGKEKAKSKWLKLKETEKDAVLLAIPNYLIARPDPTYRKDPERYLSHRVWEDELPIFGNQATQETKVDTSQFEMIIPEQWQ